MAFYTFGCKVNSYDTIALQELFIQEGFNITQKEEEADIYVINSCTVTAESGKKVFKKARSLRQKKPNSLIAITGCLSENSFEKCKETGIFDVITGTHNRQFTLQGVMQKLAIKQSFFELKEDDLIYQHQMIKSMQDKTRAFIKIQDGCNNFCSYCIIPYTRGRQKSRPILDIIKECEFLADNGYSEIVLVGINLASYGSDLTEKISLSDVVLKVAEIDRVKRIRLGSLEADLISDEDILKLSKLEKFCPSFHLSVQSGCDKTLKAMNRKYTTEQYEKLIEKIRKNFDNPGISTDIMVGFSGETEKDFDESVEFCQKMVFSRCHIFMYSPRPGTKAEKFDGRVEESEKKRRSKHLIALMHQKEEEFKLSQIGTHQQVLLEQKKDGYYEGYTKNYIQVKYYSNEDNLSGQTVDIILDEQCLI